MLNNSLDNSLLRTDSARLFLNIPPRTFYQYRSHDPKFPKGVKLESGKVAYYQKDLEDYKKLMEQGERPTSARKARAEAESEKMQGSAKQGEQTEQKEEPPQIQQIAVTNRLDFTGSGIALENESDERIMRVKEAAAILGVSRATFYRMVKSIEGFPQPLSIGVGSKGFLMSEIKGFIQQRMQERDSNRGKQC